MPGRSASDDPWRKLPLLVDTSAGARAEHSTSHDYDTLAEVLEFKSIWLAPAGTIP